MNLEKANKSIKSVLVFFFVFFGFFIASTTSFAQTESFSFDVTPQNPEPYSTVRVSISSFSVDLDRASLTWTLDENLILSGIGKTQTTFQTKGLGEISVLKVEALFSNGLKLNKVLAIQPAYLDILWEASDSYTPPFYKGKALPTPETIIKVVAVPEIKSYGGSKYNPSSLVYTWKKGIETQQSSSGFNKQYFSFKHSVFDKDQRIGVEVASQDGFSRAEGSTLITFTKPIVAIYKEDSRKGLDLSRELSREGNSVSGKTSLAAVPYFFSVDKSDDSDLRYVWKINDRQTTPPGKKSKLTIEKGGEEGGSANIKLSIESITKLFQEGSRSFNINLR